MSILNDILAKEAVTLVRILELIRREGPISQVELGQKVGLGRAAINIHMKKLVASGLVEPTGSCEGATGRPRVLLDLKRDGRAVLGISLDSPHLSGAVMDFNNRILYQSQRDLRAVQTKEQLEQELALLADDLQQEASRRGLELCSCCFSAPGLLQPGTGRILNYVNMPVANGLDAKRILGAKLNTPVYVVSIVTAIYWGALAAEQGNQLIFHILWDLGVGMAFGRGYEVGLRDYQTAAPGAPDIEDNIREIGHTVLHAQGRLCHCGRRGCLEAYFGGSVLLEEYNRTHPQHPLSFPHYLERMRNPEGEIAATLRRKARRLGETLGWIFSVHRPDHIKLSGLIPDAASYVSEAFYDGVRRRLGQSSPFPTTLTHERDVHTLEVQGACRLALHVRFNEPLLGVVSNPATDS